MRRVGCTLGSGAHAWDYPLKDEVLNVTWVPRLPVTSLTMADA